MKKSYDFSKGVKNPYLKRIVVSVKVENALDVSKSLRCDAVVDTNVSLMVLPATWKDKLGSLESTGIIEVGTSIQGTIKGEACGPVRIQIGSFRPIHTEVVFVEAELDVGGFEPLLGHIVLAQSQAGVDMIGNRLIHIKHTDLKGFTNTSHGPFRRHSHCYAIARKP
ncbi:MAG: hypothetical protein ACR2HX_17345 [Pyrinomonadaceae bacterium]